MVLYAAKLKATAKPVSKKTDLKKKAEPIPEPLAEVEPVVDKKLLAKEKRQQAARLKKEQAEAELKRQQEEAELALQAKEAELKAAEDALLAKKQAQKEKRRLQREAKKLQTPPESVTTTEDVPMKKAPVKRKRKEQTIDEQVDEAVNKLSQTEEEPPAWFRKYVAGVKNEERMHQEPKKPKKEVAREANAMAEQQWGNGLVRDRVRNEVDKHMSRMYQMIFNRGSFDGL